MHRIWKLVGSRFKKAKERLHQKKRERDVQEKKDKDKDCQHWSIWKVTLYLILYKSYIYIIYLTIIRHLTY
jgi:hypothetical protein